MSLINWQVKPEYVLEKKAEVEFMLARKQQVSIQLTKDMAELIKLGVDVVVPARLTITQKSREVQMEKFGYKNHNGDECIEYDEVMNNAPIIKKEYSITIDQVSGKFHLCHDAGDTETIIQGIIAGYIKANAKGEKPPGAHFDNTVEQEEGTLKQALFSGTVYFENLPVDIMGIPVTAEQATPIQEELQLEEKEDVKDEKKSSRSKEEVCPKLPPEESLRLLKKGQLKPPRGTSRTIRNEWWGKLRDLYPNSFDIGGNWLGWVDGDNTDSVMETANVADKGTKKEIDKKSSKATLPEQVPGLLQAVGEGNRMTNMADKNIRKGFILGALVKGKGYSTLSTPTRVGDEQGSALIIVNKPRTGKFMLAGLSRNESFTKKVKGYDLVDVMTFHTKYFTESSLVYFVTNAVTALQELGTQEKDIVDIKENSA